MWSCGYGEYQKYTGIEYKHLTYEGGNPAVIACVRGEVEVVPQLACEEVDMIRAKNFVLLLY